MCANKATRTALNHLESENRSAEVDPILIELGIRKRFQNESGEMIHFVDENAQLTDDIADDRNAGEEGNSMIGGTLFLKLELFRRS